MGDDGQLRGVLGPLEAEVMRAVWADGGAVSVRDVLGVLNDGRPQPLAYTTVMTVMARLAEKGVLEREHQGRGYVYRALVADSAAIAVRNVMRDFGDIAVAHFVEEARADPKLLRRLTKLLGEDA
ncbi:MAG: BlaI/MecI/CopY family transcriptional regulator [Acidimicrobiales bacterium]